MSRKSPIESSSAADLPGTARRSERPGAGNGSAAPGRSIRNNSFPRAARPIVLVACAAIVLAGCSLFRSQEEPQSATATDSPTSRPATTRISHQDVSLLPSDVQTDNHPVVRGPLPLVYLVENDGTLRVRNAETDEEIITFDAKRNQIVRVESRGVFVAGKSVIGANLAPGKYAIEFVYPDANAVRATQTHTGVIKSQ